MKLAVRKLDKANQISLGYSVITTNISILAEDTESYCPMHLNSCDHCQM